MMTFALITVICLQLAFYGMISIDRQPSLETSSLKRSSHVMMPTEEIDPKEYHVFDNSCLEPAGFNGWKIRVKTKQNYMLKRDILLKYRVFVGNGKLVDHNFKVVYMTKP